MAFFVVARTSDGNLQLVSQATFPSRQEAMSALSEATREPDFPHWDAELLVVDLDSSVPVLLVRPAQLDADEPAEAEPLEIQPPEAPAVAGSLEFDAVAAGETIEEVPIIEDLPEAAAEERHVMETALAAEELLVAEDATSEETEAILDTTTPEPEVAKAPVEFERADQSQVAEPPFETYAAEPVPLGDAIADEILAEFENGTLEAAGASGVAAEEPAAASEETREVAEESEPIPGDGSSLTVSALMAESAIADAVLESEAPADAPVVDEVFADFAVPRPADEPESAVSIEERLHLEEPSVDSPAVGSWQPEPVEPDLEPQESQLSAAGDEGHVEPKADAPLEGGVVIAWPWDRESGEESAVVAEDLIADIELVAPPADAIADAVEEDLVLDSLLVEPAPAVVQPDEPVAALEEAVVEEVDLVAPSEETPEASEPAEIDEPQMTADAEVEAQLEMEPTDVAAPEQDPEAVSLVDSVGTSRDEIADFIFDLENVTGIPEAAGNEDGGARADEGGPSCGECVYDDTCPNREQRSPQECGSFQWKIA